MVFSILRSRKLIIFIRCLHIDALSWHSVYHVAHLGRLLQTLPDVHKHGFSVSLSTIPQAACWDSDLQLKIDTLKLLCQSWWKIPNGAHYSCRISAKEEKKKMNQWGHSLMTRGSKTLHINVARCDLSSWTHCFLYEQGIAVIHLSCSCWWDNQAIKSLIG